MPALSFRLRLPAPNWRQTKDAAPRRPSTTTSDRALRAFGSPTTVAVRASPCKVNRSPTHSQTSSGASANPKSGQRCIIDPPTRKKHGSSCWSQGPRSRQHSLDRNPAIRLLVFTHKASTKTLRMYRLSNVARFISRCRDKCRKADDPNLCGVPLAATQLSSNGQGYGTPLVPRSPRSADWQTVTRGQR